jgi:hypothetical protein
MDNGRTSTEIRCAKMSLDSFLGGVRCEALPYIVGKS